MLDPGGLILLAGQAEKANPMTVSWGHFGVMWNKPVFIVHVRPTRHTFNLMEKGEDFTLNVIPESNGDILDFCGRKSGRDLDKVKELNLNLLPSLQTKTPAIAEADIIFECRIIYKDTIKPENFLDPGISKLYPGRDFHMSYWGEIMEIRQKSKTI